MTDLQLEDSTEFARPVTGNEQPYFIRLVLSTGLVKTEQNAGYVLLGAIIFCIVVAIYLFATAGPSAVHQATPAELNQA